MTLRGTVWHSPLDGNRPRPSQPNPQDFGHRATLPGALAQTTRLIETILKNGLMFDALGVIGLGLVGLAAVKLARSSLAGMDPGAAR